MDDFFDNTETTDVSTDPMDVVNRVLLDRMITLLGSMKAERNLCEDYSSGVVAEFLFKGNKFEVEFQLNKLIEYRKVVPYTEEDRPALIAQAARFMEYVKSVSNNPIKLKIRNLNMQLWQSYRSDIQLDLDNARNQLHFNQRSRHDKKECICFCNF